MPSKSKSQQRLFGMVKAYQDGELKNASEKVKDIAKSMTKKEVEKFAKTKRKGLPNHVKKSELKEFVEHIPNVKNNPQMNLFNVLRDYQTGKKDSKKANGAIDAVANSKNRKDGPVKISEEQLVKIVQEAINELKTKTMLSAYNKMQDLRQYNRAYNLRDKSTRLVYENNGITIYKTLDKLTVDYGFHIYSFDFEDGCWYTDGCGPTPGPRILHDRRAANIIAQELAEAGFDANKNQFISESIDEKITKIVQETIKKHTTIYKNK